MRPEGLELRADPSAGRALRALVTALLCGLVAGGSAPLSSMGAQGELSPQPMTTLRGPSAAQVELTPQAEALQATLGEEAVRRALTAIDANAEQAADFLAEIAAIVSPSGHEHDRARAVAARMREIGLQEVRVDESPNAIGVVPGSSGRALVFIATLDDLADVADHQRSAPHPPRIEGDRVVGPGTNTSSTTAAVLAAAEALVQSGIQPPHDIVFAAVAQEETGLLGMNNVYDEYRDRAVGFVDVLGDGRSISYGALGLHWWRIVAHGPPGHSLGGGLPNVNQGIAQAVERILDLPQPQEYSELRTVLNVAQIHSGTVFNHKPETGWFSLDLRSLDGGVIDEMEAAVREILASVSDETAITFEMEPFQITPGGQIPGALDSDLVQTSVAISRHLGFEPRLGNSGSSNMNVAVGQGTLAIGLGGGRGGDRATPEEWADIPALIRTAKHVLLLALALR